MTLRMATDFLIAGLFYTIIHKAILFLFGSSLSDLMFAIYLIIWLAATGTIILFCIYFLKEVNPQNNMIRLTLKTVIIFIGIIIFLRVPFNLLPATFIFEYLLIDLSRFFVVVSLFVFLLNFHRELSQDHFKLKMPILILIIGFGINAVFGFIANYPYLNFIITGNHIEPMEILTPVANIAGLATLIAEFYFLLRFRKIVNYKTLLVNK